MIGRHVTLSHWFERDDGSEFYAELDCTVTEPERPTLYEPHWPGEILRDALRIDGRTVCLGQYRAIADAIIEQEEIPEPDEEFA